MKNNNNDRWDCLKLLAITIMVMVLANFALLEGLGGNYVKATYNLCWALLIVEIGGWRRL